MNYNHFRIIVVLLLASLLVTYTNCGSPFSAPSELVFENNVYGGSSEASYQAFEQTVYPITRSYCISCHSSDQQPLHAADDVKKAHDEVISKFKVNFAHVPTSRLVLKLRDGNHNCWGDCGENADEMQAAIEKWKTAIKSTAPARAPAEVVLETEETDTLEREFSDPSNTKNSVRLNIEAANLKAPMARFSPATGEPYLSVPNQANNILESNSASAGIAYFSFRVPTDANYKIFALVQGNNGSDNSFHVNVLDGNQSMNRGPKKFDYTAGSAFVWREVPDINASLRKDRVYTLEMRQREDGAKLAGVIVTSDPDFDGQNIDDYFGVTLSFDLTNLVKVPGATLQIDVSEYDPYSYKFSEPRIVSSTSNIYVKGLKLLVNGVFNPQHSTYTIVDKIVTPTDNVLSEYSMIVIKDKGLEGDHISFSFDELLATSSDGSGAGATTGSTGGGTTGQTSLEAFQATVYPVSRSSAYSCIGCHDAGGRFPQHSSDNTLAAHNSMLGRDAAGNYIREPYVDFNNPAGSKIIDKMKVERHNCQNYCDSIAGEYEKAIMEWKTRRE